MAGKHGYVDSISVPMHLSSPALAPSGKAAKGKGKEKDVGTAGQGGGGAVYDVVASWTAEEKDEVERKVAMAALLGYSTVILTISITPTTNPSILSFPTPLLPSLDPRTAKPGTEGMVMQLWKIEVAEYNEEAIKSTAVKGFYGLSNSTAGSFPPSTSVLSIIPTSLPVFSHVALSLSPPSAFSPSFITIDPSLSPRLPFPLKRGLVNTLQRSGVMFEIVLRGMTKQDDALGGAGSRRRNWIAGAREIVRATGGQGIVLSSGAVKAGEMRGTEDIINLCHLIGLTAVQAKDAMTTNPQKAILRGLAMRQTYRGVISNPTVTIINVAGASPTDYLDTPSTLGSKRPAEEATAPKQQSSTGKKGQGGKKRKIAAGGGNRDSPKGETGDVGGAS